LQEDISDINSVIAMLDSVENIRVLSDQERIFRINLKTHLQFLLKQQLAHWKQRGKIKWVTLGDANSKFFHSIATVQKRKNHISSLTSISGVSVSDHQSKAALLLEAYKDRLGWRENVSNHYDMADLLANEVDLAFLEQPFTPKEIDDVVVGFPNNKSPGPDGFNAEFLRKCWPIFKNDFYDLCNQFYKGNLCLESINGCFITLIPKKEDAASVNDFRPISLLNCTLKLLTKILANRLQSVILKLIHENQYGFIKSRTIQDCLA
jgi:hypothetical protein